MWAFLFSLCRGGVREAGVECELSRGAAPGGPLAQPLARCDGRDAPVVAGGRAVWHLRATRTLQCGLWRTGGCHWLDHLVAAFRSDYFPRRRLERGAGGESQRGSGPCMNRLSVWSATPDIRRTSVP